MLMKAVLLISLYAGAGDPGESEEGWISVAIPYPTMDDCKVAQTNMLSHRPKFQGRKVRGGTWCREIPVEETFKDFVEGYWYD